MKRVALIDADVVMHQCAHSADITYYKYGTKEWRYAADAKAWHLSQGISKEEFMAKREKHRVKGDIKKVMSGIDWLIQSIIRATESEEFILFLSGKKNFRKKLAVTKPYKGNRNKEDRPLTEKEAKAYLIDEYGAVQTDGVEADDALGMHQNDGTIICSVDKDLLQIPGLHYNWRKDKIVEIDCRTGNYNLYKQVLQGDKVDNIPGVPGYETAIVGGRKADKLLTTLDSRSDMHCAVGLEYAANFDDPETMMKEIGGLVYILRDEDDEWVV